MTIGLGIQIILMLLPQQFEMLQCWKYWWEGFMKYAVELVSGEMMHSEFHEDWYRCSEFIWGGE
jgi:hypothetical protein